MDPEFAAVLLLQAVGELAEHAQAEVLEDRQHVRQRQRRVGVVQLAVQLLAVAGQRLVEAHHQRAGVGQAEQVLHVDHRRGRGEALAVAGREALREIRQHAGALGLAETLDHQPGVVVLPRAAGLDHLALELLGIDVQLGLRIDAQDELHTRQHRLGEVGPELAITGLQALDQYLLDAQAGLGGIHVARHVGQRIDEAAVGVHAQEHAQLVALLDLHDGHHGAEQFIHRGLEQVIARQHLEHLLQFLAQVALGVEAGAAEHLVHLAADIGDAPHALGVHRGGVDAEEAALLDHLALGVEGADRHEVRVGRTMHAAGHGGLGEGQQHRLAQVAHRIGLDVQVVLAEAGAQTLGQAQQRALVILDIAAVGLLVDGEFLVAEEGEVVVQQPLEEHLDLGQFGLVHLELGLAQPGQQFLGLGLHRQEVDDRQAHVAEHLQQAALQAAQLAVAGAAVDLQEDQRLLRHVLAGAALGQDLQQLALLVAAHAEHAVLQGVDAVAATVHLHAHRIDQERDVRVQHLDRGVGRLPAVLLVVRVEHLHLRLRRLEALHQPPGRQGAADQVGQPSLGEFVESDDAEELFGEQRHLWQRLFADVLSQSRLQLMLEVGFAGHGEERHADTPLDLLYGRHRWRDPALWFQAV
ncbi:hypothetical protein FQZ97_347150 [compost metagenome]